ncbi:MAG: alkaline phosphatase family protein [Deltaproteobacteria bacterium]|nr:alkaline phosphatase family protein [Deltaproteobacteria bacterium]
MTRAVAKALDKTEFDVLASLVRETDTRQHRLMFYFLIKYASAGRTFRYADPALAKVLFFNTDRLVKFYRNLDMLVGRVIDDFPDDYFIVASDHGFEGNWPHVTLELNDHALTTMGVPDGLHEENAAQPVTLPNIRADVSWKEKATLFAFLEDERTGKRIDFQVTHHEYFYRPTVLDEATTQALFEKLTAAADEINRPSMAFLNVEKRYDGVVVGAPPSFVSAARYIMDYGPGSPWMVNCSFNGHNSTDPGVFMIAGPGVAKGKIVSATSLFDLTPTLLYLKGKPVGADMDGRVLTEIVDPELLAARPVSTIPTHDDDAFLGALATGTRELTPEEIHRLESLGYLR